MTGIFINTKTNKKNNSDKTITELYEFYEKYVLYPSPKVIISFSNYFQFMYRQSHNEESDPKNTFAFYNQNNG